MATKTKKTASPAPMFDPETVAVIGSAIERLQPLLGALAAKALADPPPRPNAKQDEIIAWVKAGTTASEAGNKTLAEICMERARKLAEEG